MVTVKDRIGMIVGFALPVGAACTISALLMIENFDLSESRGYRFLKCELGRPVAGDDVCAAKQLTELEQRAEDARLELERLEAEKRHHQAGSAVIESSRDLGGYYASVSSVYADMTRRAGLVSAICSASSDFQGPDQSVQLARMTGNRIDEFPVTRDARAALNLNADEIETARANCPWPSTSSN